LTFGFKSKIKTTKRLDRGRCLPVSSSVIPTVAGHKEHHARLGGPDVLGVLAGGRGPAQGASVGRVEVRVATVGAGPVEEASPGRQAVVDVVGRLQVVQNPHLLLPTLLGEVLPQLEEIPAET